MKTNGYLIIILAFLWLSITPVSAQQYQKILPDDNFPVLIPNSFKSPEELISQQVKNSLKYRNTYKSNSDINDYQIDSIIVYAANLRGSREIYYYDVNGNLITYLLDVRNVAEWIHAEMNSYTYDENNNLLTELKMTRAGAFWEKSYLLSYTYNSWGNMLHALIQQWQNGEWIGINQYTYTYNENGNISIYLEQAWLIDKWIDSFRLDNTYDDRGNLQKSLRKIWQEGDWQNSSQETNTYNITGDLLTAHSEIWDGFNWVSFELNTYTYDANGYLSAKLDQYFNHEWRNSNKYNYINDDDGNILTFLEQYWENDAWKNVTLITYTFDQNGNKLNELRQEWQDTWNFIYYFTFTYNEIRDCLVFVSYLWSNNTWDFDMKVEYQYTNGLIRGNSFTWDGTGWIAGDAWMDLQRNIDDELVHYYSCWGSVAEVYFSSFYTSADKPSVETITPFSAYPNPAVDIISISIDPVESSRADIYLYDFSGKKITTIYTGTISPGGQRLTYDVTGLAPGLYFLAMNTNGQSYRQKLTITK